MFVYVYGTLKEGNSNNHYLDNAEFIEEAEFTANHTMFTLLNNYNGSLYKRFPCLIKTPQIKNTIKGEIFKIDEETLMYLDQLESNGSMYQREEVEINGKTCFVYYFISNNFGGIITKEDEF